MPKHWSEMDGLTEPEACAHLAALGMQVPHDQAIVEVGVYKGRSLAALATYATAQVVGIDPWNLPRKSKAKYSSDETYATAKANLEGYENVTLIKQFSVTAAENWLLTFPRIGLLYIDSDHRYAPVLADFAAWSAHFAPGATVAFDDCHPDFPGVPEAVERLEELGRIRFTRMLTDRLCVAEYVQ